MNFIRLCNFDILANINPQSSKAVVVLHGFGASAQDLAPISQAFQEFQQYSWYFVDAPLEVPLGMGMVGKAWYPLDMAAISQAIASGTFLDLYRSNTPEGMVKVLEDLIPLMDELSSKHSSLSLGGFSQGSIISSHLITLLKDNFSKLFLFSSAFVDQKRLESEYQKERTLKVFQSHGEADPVLPFAGAIELKEFYEKKNIEHHFSSFNGGHEIPLPILQQFKTFLEE